MSETILDALDKPKEDSADSSIVNGIVPAIVTNLKDPEKLGRIKVHFPWLEKESETDWVRVSSFYAGDGRGAFFLPEVGDEVLVAYQMGNINAPYVIGSLYSKKAKPPEDNADGKNNIKIFKSRCGHTLTFDETDSKQKIELKSNAGHTVTLDDASGKENISIVDKSGSNKIIIDTMKNSITIKAGQEITIDSGLTLNLKATNIKVEASAQLELKGAMVTLQASGINTIKGSMVKIN